jgi:hypothetical protein
MIVVKSAMAALLKIRHDLMHPSVQSIWVQVDLGNRFLVGGLYREWSDLPREYAALTWIKDQVQAAAAEVDNVVLAGNVNLDRARRGDKKYVRRCLLLAHDNAIAEANRRYLTTGVTYRSHGLHKREDGEARGHESFLDQVCTRRDLEATVTVLTDSTTDHFPVVAAIKVNRVTPTQKTMERRNFKALERPSILRALDNCPWSDVYGIMYPDKVLDFFTRGIVDGLDQVAPVKSITVKEGLLPLYLRPDTLALMAKRDSLSSDDHGRGRMGVCMRGEGRGVLLLGQLVDGIPSNIRPVQTVLGVLRDDHVGRVGVCEDGCLPSGSWATTWRRLYF